MCVKRMFKYILIYVKKKDLVECIRYREDIQGLKGGGNRKLNSTVFPYTITIIIKSSIDDTIY